jgi:hypothetical protein
MAGRSQHDEDALYDESRGRRGRWIDRPMRIGTLIGVRLVDLLAVVKIDQSGKWLCVNHQSRQTRSMRSWTRSATISHEQ